MNTDRANHDISDTIIHITHSPDQNAGGMSFVYNGKTVLKQTQVTFTPKDVNRFIIDGEPVIKKKNTANGEVFYIENAREEFDYSSFSVSLEFEIGSDELLLGMGQYEDGIFDYRNHTEYLYESNMRIAIPFLVTTGNYGIYIESESNMIFHSEKNIIRFEIDTADEISYYVILGENIDEIIQKYHTLTGSPSMLPKWIFGYVQSKERYVDAKELTTTVSEFRKRNIPIDCIVQDWFSWEDGLWGEKILDKKRFPNMPQTVNELHNNNVKLMLSIWPNMNCDSQNYKEFYQADKLLPNSNVYDAFDEDAARLYFNQTKREIMAAGTDALWCDNAEPFSDADWSGQNKKPEDIRCKLVVDTSKQSMDWKRINGYGLWHARGIYENWRASYPQKRVVNLTRSGYSSCQQYGTILWSGDICAKWDVMKKQIAEGLKMGLSGMPYWTLDIGGFFVKKQVYENHDGDKITYESPWFWNGDFDEGVGDKGYCELYTRWLQFGTFLPIFRSHGTDTPREPWQFEEPFYSVIVKYINLRYSLMPYIYSLAYMAHQDNRIIMRALAYDFADDKKAIGICDEYMFGNAFLVAPVTEPMYFAPGSVPIDNTGDEAYTRLVYLPEGYCWYDFYTSKVYDGGQSVHIEAPLDTMPLLAKAGSIIPMSEPIQYSDENKGAVSKIRVYAGADGDFTLYNDASDGYEYENGEYCRIDIHYDDKARKLTLSDASGSYKLTKIDCIGYIEPGVPEKNIELDYSGSKCVIDL